MNGPNSSNGGQPTKDQRAENLGLPGSIAREVAGRQGGKGRAAQQASAPRRPEKGKGGEKQRPCPLGGSATSRDKETIGKLREQLDAQGSTRATDSLFMCIQRLNIPLEIKREWLVSGYARAGHMYMPPACVCIKRCKDDAAFARWSQRECAAAGQHSDCDLFARSPSELSAGASSSSSVGTTAPSSEVARVPVRSPAHQEVPVSVPVPIPAAQAGEVTPDRKSVV